nr:MAG TPA: hypothetical protein [Caudoviricetes sp.]
MFDFGLVCLYNKNNGYVKHGETGGRRTPLRWLACRSVQLCCISVNLF